MESFQNIAIKALIENVSNITWEFESEEVGQETLIAKLKNYRVEIRSQVNGGRTDYKLVVMKYSNCDSYSVTSYVDERIHRLYDLAFNIYSDSQREVFWRDLYSDIIDKCEEPDEL